MDSQNCGTGPSQHSGRFIDPDPGFRPQQAHTGFTAAEPLVALRSWFSDAKMALPTLMTLNNALQPDSRQGRTDPMEVWAAIAAKFSGTLNKPDEEPGVAMAKHFSGSAEAGRDDLGADSTCTSCLLSGRGGLRI